MFTCRVNTGTDDIFTNVMRNISWVLLSAPLPTARFATRRTRRCRCRPWAVSWLRCWAQAWNSVVVRCRPQEGRVAAETLSLQPCSKSCGQPNISVRKCSNYISNVFTTRNSCVSILGVVLDDKWPIGLQFLHLHAVIYSYFQSSVSVNSCGLKLL